MRFLPARGLLVDQELLVVDDIIAQHTVEVDFKSLAFVEVTQGLRKGDFMVVDDQNAFQEGERVWPMVVIRL